MISKKEIEDKKKYIIDTLKGYNTVDAKAKLTLTLANLMALETQNEDLSNVRLYSIIDKVTNGKLTLKRNKTAGKILEGFPYKRTVTMSNDYFMYLLNIIIILKDSYNEFKSENDFKKISMSDDDKSNMARDFFRRLGSPVITNYSEKIFNDPSHFGFSNKIFDHNTNILGVTYGDFVFNKPYMSVKRFNNIRDVKILCHEVMHGICFYLGQKDLRIMNIGHDEIASVTINNLFPDYLEEIGYDKDQIDVLRNNEKIIIASKANELLFKISGKLCEIANPPVFNDENIRKLYKSLDFGTLIDMLNMESFMVSYGLYKQIRINKELGLNNLYKVIVKKPLESDMADYSYIGLDRKTILNLANEYAGELYYKKYGNRNK